MSIAVALMLYHALHSEKSSASMPWMWDRWLEEAHARGRNECQQSASDTARRDNWHNCSKTLLFRHRYLATRWHLRQQGEKWHSDEDIFTNRAFFFFFPPTASLDKTWFVPAGKTASILQSLQWRNMFQHSCQVLHLIYGAVRHQ